MATRVRPAGRLRQGRRVGQTDLGKRFREARLRAGLSQVELSEKLGVSQEAVSATELGRLPRHSTLMAYLRVLPWITVHDLFPQSRAPRPSSPAAWARLRESFGFVAQLCRVEFTTPSSGNLMRKVQVLGVACDEAAFTPTIGQALMRAVAYVEHGQAASIIFPARVPTSSKPLAHQDAMGRHRFWITPDKRGVRLVHYELYGPAPAEHGTAYLVSFPAERLEFVLLAGVAAAPLRARPWVRPASIPLAHAEPNLAQLMHPTATVVTTVGQGLYWGVDKPLPGFEYGLEVGQGAPASARVPRWSLATTLRTARAQAGLSLRDVAVRAKVCHASVAYAEGGRDPRLGTLSGYLEAIPSLSPQELLPAHCSSGVLTHAETWELLRDIYGYEVRQLHKTIKIDRDGSSAVAIETTGLRPLRYDLREMRVRTGLQRAVSQASASTVLAIESALETLRVRRIRKDEGPVSHEFCFPSRLATGSLSHTRRLSGPRYTLRKRDSSRTLSAADDLYAGVGLPISHPVECAVLEARLPRGFEPRWVRAYIWPNCIVPDRDLPVLSSHLATPPCRVVVASECTRISASVDHPLIGMRLALAWGVPD